MPSLDDVLARAPETPLEDSALIRGTIVRTADEGRLIVQRSRGPRAEWAEFEVGDVVRGPWEVDERDLDADEIGLPIYELGIRMGAIARHVQEAECEARRLSPRITRDGVEESGRHDHHVTFQGVVQTLHEEGDLLLAPEPNDHTDCAVFRRSDVLDPEHIEVVPADSLPPAQRGFTVVQLRVHPSARVRVLFQRYRRVDQSAPECLRPREKSGHAHAAAKGVCRSHSRRTA